MILTVKILTGSPETWQEIEASAVEVFKQCAQCTTTFKTSNLDKKYCSEECSKSAANQRYKQREKVPPPTK